nr:protein-disulfide reductase DsbD domain-containing protein [Pseudomonas fluorescens]
MFRRFISAIIGLTCLAVLVSAHGFEFTSNQEFLPVHEAFKVSATGTPDSVQIQIMAAPGYYLYKSKLSFQAKGIGVQPGAAVLPAGEHKDDPYFGKVEVYHNTLIARLPVQNHSADGFDVTVGFQGCAEKGLCYPPDQQIIHIGGDAGIEAASGWSATSVASAYVEGLKLFLTPGVLPVIPLLAFVLLLGELSARRGITIGLAFTAPMAAGFVVLNSAIAITEAGIEIQPIAQSVWILVPSVLILLGLATRETEIPSSQRDGHQHQAGSLFAFLTSASGAALLGLVALIYTTPFTSSAQAAVMLYLKAGGELIGGIAQLAGLALGMISPLVLAAMTLGGLLSSNGKWNQAIFVSVRGLLAIVGFWVLGRVLPGPVTLGLYGLVAVWSAVSLGVFGSLSAARSLPTRAAAIVVLLYGVFAWIGMLKGETSPSQPLGHDLSTGGVPSEQRWVVVSTPQQLAAALAEAKTSGNPALVEWVADWAPGSDQVADTARHVRLIRGSLGALKTIRVDITEGGLSTRSLLELNGLFGPAAVQVYRSDGVEVQSARLVGVTTSKEIVESLQAVVDNTDK